MSQKIEFYKIRQFGEKLSVSIDYFRRNIKSLAVIGLIVGIPVGLLSSYFFSSFFDTAANLENLPVADQDNLIVNFIFSYFAYFLMSLLVGSLMVGSVYTYMLESYGRDTPPSAGEVFGKALARVPGLIVLTLVIAIISVLGFTLFFFPGLYLLVVFSLAFPVFIFEKASVGQALSRPFKLIKGKWFSTFGLILLTSMLAGIASYVFAIPMYVGMFGNMFQSVDNQDPEAMLGYYQSWQMIAGTAIYTIGAYILFIVPLLALAFQYFNLKERAEGVGIRSEISEFENLQ